MKLGLNYREQIRAMGGWLLDELDALIASLQGAWKTEHTDNDQHGHVHAQSLQVGRVSFSDILTPEAFASAQVNNFNDGRLRDAGVLRLTSSLSEVAFTGIQVPQDETGAILDGRLLILENDAESCVFVLEHEATQSSPANRFHIPMNPASVTGATNRFFIPPKSMAICQYNSKLARWMVMSRSHDEVMSYAEFGSSQNDYAPANFRAARVVRLVPTAANLTVTGFDATSIPVPHRKTIINEGIYRFAINHMNTGSAAANRVQCPAGSMYYLHPRESVDLYRETDGTWHIILKADEWVDVPYSAGNFTANAGTWGVDSGDQVTYSYHIDGNKMTVQFEIHTSDVSAAAAHLRLAVPAGRTIARTTRTIIEVIDAGAPGLGYCEATAGNTYLKIFTGVAGAAFTVTAADNTYVLGQITFMVETACGTVSELHTDTAHGDTAHADADHSDVAHIDTAHVDSHADVTHADAAHGDSAHADSHSDTAHSDTAHDDVAHVDGAHQDSHADTAHADTHTDLAHGDFQDGAGGTGLHEDAPHEDSHTDTAHDDSHSDASHGDVAHSDVAHADVTHADTHTDDAHSDSGHSDTPHSDSHSDTPHDDTAHVDGGHSDTAHIDTPHVDVGYHCDTAHADV